MSESTFKVLLIPCNPSLDFQVIEVLKNLNWEERVGEILNAKKTISVWPKVNEKIAKGGRLIIDALWYESDKKNHKNDRGTALFNRDLFGDMVLADVWYCDEDESGNPLDHPYDVFENVDVKFYNELLHRVQTGQKKTSKGVLYDIKKSLQKHGFEEIPETYVQTQWKLVTPKSLLFEYYQAYGWSAPAFQKVSTNPHGPHRMSVHIEPFNKSFTPEQGSKSVKESEHNASLLALKFLMEEQSTSAADPEDEEAPEIDELTVEDDPSEESTPKATSEFTHFTATKLKHAINVNPDSKLDEQSAHRIVNVDLPTISIVPDGGILKQILKAADENAISPSPKYMVSIHYDAYFSDGKVHDTTRRSGVPHTFKHNKGAVLPAIDIAMGSMRVGEVARFVCSSKYCYGELGVPDSVPPNAAIIYEMELVHAESPETSSKELMRSLPPSHRLQQAATLKNEGNELFKLDNLRAALKCYSKALDLVTYSLDNFSEEEKTQASALKVNLHLNCAAVHLKNMKWEKVIFHSSQALEIEGNNTKGLLIRAKGYRNLNLLDQCKADLEAVLVLNPKDKDASAEWKLFQEKERQWREVERNMFSKMLKNKPDQAV